MASYCRTALSTAGYSRSPSGVSRMPYRERYNNFIDNSRSSEVIIWLSAGWV